MSVVDDLFGGMGDGFAPPDRERWATHDADFTPPAVVRQGLSTIARELGTPARVVWDPCAGAGVFGQVARDLWGRSRILLATEPRAEERPHLERHYDAHAIGSCLDALTVGELFSGVGMADAIATNPAWNVWPDVWRACWPALVEGGWLALLGPVSWGASFEAAEALDLFVAEPPVLELRIPGRIRFRTGVNPKTGKPFGSDHRKCAWWVWVRGESPLKQRAARTVRTAVSAWTTVVLPPLPPEALRWTTRPGAGPLPW